MKERWDLLLFKKVYVPSLNFPRRNQHLDLNSLPSKIVNEVSWILLIGQKRKKKERGWLCHSFKPSPHGALEISCPSLLEVDPLFGPNRGPMLNRHVDLHANSANSSFSKRITMNKRKAQGLSYRFIKTIRMRSLPFSPTTQKSFPPLNSFWKKSCNSSLCLSAALSFPLHSSHLSSFVTHATHLTINPATHLAINPSMASWVL